MKTTQTTQTRYATLELGWAYKLSLPLELAHAIQTILSDPRVRKLEGTHNSHLSKTIEYLAPLEQPTVQVVDLPEFDASRLTPKQILGWKKCAEEARDTKDLIAPDDFAALTREEDE